MTEVTSIGELKDKVDQLYNLREQISELEQTESLLKEEIQNILIRNDLKSFQATACVASVVVKESVSPPKAEEDKKAFFKWLRERNLFWELATVNGQSLTKLYNSEKEEAGGADIKIPGVAPAYSRFSLSLRKKS